MTEEVVYIDFFQAVRLHFELMRLRGETRFGIDSRDLVESALARPRHASVYEDADLIRQAATLCFGLIKNHPWIGGNKRTASFLMDTFLFNNGIEMTASVGDVIEMVLAVEADRWHVNEIEAWLRPRSVKL